MDQAGLNIMALEIEKKFRITEEQRKAVVAALEEFGAEFRGQDNEENIIYSSDKLVEENAVLRVRRIDERTLLTFKKRLPAISDIKHQLEEETEVADAEVLMRILAHLGIAPRLIYEKRRRTWRFRSVDVMIDELPFGLYMEIEGAFTAIREAELLLDTEKFVQEEETYPRLTARSGKQNGEIVEARFNETVS